MATIVEIRALDDDPFATLAKLVEQKSHLAHPVDENSSLLASNIKGNYIYCLYDLVKILFDSQNEAFFLFFSLVS